MFDLFKAIIQIQAPFNMIVLICLLFAVAGMISAIAKEIRKYGCHRQDIDFKRELVDRGLDSEEIVRIVSAKPAASNAPVTTIGGNYYAPPRQPPRSNLFPLRTPKGVTEPCSKHCRACRCSPNRPIPGWKLSLGWTRKNDSC